MSMECPNCKEIAFESVAINNGVHEYECSECKCTGSFMCKYTSLKETLIEIAKTQVTE